MRPINQSMQRIFNKAVAQRKRNNKYSDCISSMLDSTKQKSQTPCFKCLELKFQTRSNDGARLLINDEEEFQSISKSFLIDS